MINDSSSQPCDENDKTSAPASEDTEAAKHKDPLQDISETIRNAFQNGGRDARRAFDETIPKVKEDFEKGIHDLAYALAYAAAFGGALVREIAPDTLKDGLREGTASGRRAADEVLRQRREKSEREARNTPPVNDDGVFA